MKMDFSFFIFFCFLAEVFSGRGAGKEFDCREGEGDGRAKLTRLTFGLGCRRSAAGPR